MTAILIIGGRGFIGRHLAAALAEAGHRVHAPGRDDLDLIRDAEPVLASRLAGYGVVINAAGLVRDRGRDTLAAVHSAGTARLAQACRAAGVARLIHLSALGATPDGPTCFQRTKGEAEAIVATGDGLDWCVLRPSLVVGRGGASTALLAGLAALPLPVRLGPGSWQVQPVLMDDLAALVVRLVSWHGPLPRRLDVVGPEPMSTDAVTLALRRWLDLAPRPFLTIPEPLLGVAAGVAERVTDGPITRTILTLVKAGNTADPGPFAAALGRMPIALARGLARCPAADADRWAARLYFLRPALRWSLGWLWVVTGLLSFGLYPPADSYRLLDSLGVQGAWADLALFGGAGLDLGLGVLLLARLRPVAVGGAMLATLLAYTLCATGLPLEYWSHPFAPLLKNVPIAVATAAMMAMES